MDLAFSRPLAQDAQEYVQMCSDERIKPWIDGIFPQATQEDFMMRFRVIGHAPLTSEWFTVRDNDDEDRFLGFCGLSKVEEGLFDTFYYVHPNHWRKGIATKMLRFLLSYGERIKLPRMVALIKPGNQVSIIVAEKVGMRLIHQTEKTIMYGLKSW